MENYKNLFAVIAVLIAIFAGIVCFLILLERKISRIEKELNKKDNETFII